MIPAIIGISGQSLSRAEAALLRALKPLGVILFARNIFSPPQLAALIADIRDVLPHALLMVDQEGGRVARLKPPHWRAHPPAAAHKNARAAWITGALIGLEAKAAGFDVVAAPVLDVGTPGASDVIGDRAFSTNPEIVAEYGAAMAAGLLAAGIQPVAKHAPGHGRAMADSHLSLPVLDTVTEADLLPFQRNRGLPWMMTAHIRYSRTDMNNPATQSAAVIEKIIRSADAIGFENLLISDDLGMNALAGTPGERAARAIAAGCDVALHCSGVLEETEQVLRALPEASPAVLAKLAAARAMAEAAHDPTLDAQKLEAERAALLA
jgi:beta-N-acetylhexosaminidase